MAMAASNQTDALGKVICDTAKNDDRLYGALVAQRERKYNPSAPVHAENTHVITPGIIPPDAMARGNDNIPVPRMVFARFPTEERNWALPSFRFGVRLGSVGRELPSNG